MSGIITATSGSIGDFTINNSIYNGKSSLTSTQNGVYIGKDGIALGANSVFKVTQNGVLTATSGSIGGASLSNDSIHASNGNWYINSDGSASFKNVTITGVQSGSNFGGLSFNNGVTSGTFSGNSSYGSNVNNPFSGTAVTHIQELAVSQITADRIRATNVFADYITASQISATYATISDLNATNLTVSGKLDAKDFTAENISAMSITVQSANVLGDFDAKRITTGTLSANRLDIKGIIDSLSTQNLLVNQLQANATLTTGLYITGGYFVFSGHYWFPKEIDGVTYLVQSSSWG